MNTLYHKHKEILRKENILNRLKEKSTEVSGVQIKEKTKIYNIAKLLEDNACKIVFLENELKIMKKDFEEIKKDVIMNIDKLDNQLYKDILFLRYICFEKWEDIAETLGYSIDHTYTLHRKAKRDLENITVNNIV